MKKSLKYLLLIGSIIISVAVLYKFVYMPREEAKKLESAQREAFFECDKRWAKISTIIVSQYTLAIDNMNCQQRKLEQDKANTELSNGTLSEELKMTLRDDTQFDFFVDGPVWCYQGQAQKLDKDSYMNLCKTWYLINVGIDPYSGFPYQVKSHYH